MCVVLSEDFSLLLRHRRVGIYCIPGTLPLNARDTVYSYSSRTGVILTKSPDCTYGSEGWHTKPQITVVVTFSFCV